MEASYKQVYSEEDVKKVEKKLSWESKKTSAERTLAESKTNLLKQEAELSTLQKQPVATDKKLAERAFTPEKTELVVWLGEGEEW